MANTGYILPQSASSTSETGWNDAGGAWINPANIYGAGDAAITDNAFDANDASHVLRAYNFNLSAIPTGSTINGVMCRINARSSSASSRIGLVQILDTSGARVGTNMAATPTNVTTSAADYTWGGSANQWGNTLTEAWVKNSNFGVGVGMLNGAANGDCYVNTVEIDVYYTIPPSSYNGTPGSGTVTVTGQNPTFLASYNKKMFPGVGGLTVTNLAPTYSTSDNKKMNPDVGAVSATGYNPVASVTNNKNLAPGVGDITVTGIAPTVTVSQHLNLLPSLGEVTFSGFAPAWSSGEFILADAIRNLQYSADGSPWLRITQSSSVNTDTLEFSLDGSPWVGVKPQPVETLNITPDTGALSITGFAPVFTASGLTFVEHILKAYSGSEWVAGTLKKHNGSEWVAYNIKNY